MNRWRTRNEESLKEIRKGKRLFTTLRLFDGCAVVFSIEEWIEEKWRKGGERKKLNARRPEDLGLNEGTL